MNSTRPYAEFSPWDKGKPESFEQVFDFYHNYVKSLYGSVQTQNNLPVEVLFELNAALDHLSRHWSYDEPEPEVVGKVFGHLKRCCLDIFKLKVKEARRQYDRLALIDTSVIDNGEFDSRLHLLFTDIVREATEARRIEGQPDADDVIPAFERWESVYLNCQKLEDGFFNHTHLSWAKRRHWVRRFVQQTHAVLFGALGSLVACWLITQQQDDKASILRWLIRGAEAWVVWIIVFEAGILKTAWTLIQGYWPKMGRKKLQEDGEQKEMEL